MVEIKLKTRFIRSISDFLFRWKNWIIRGIFTWIMIGFFVLIVYGGPLALMVTVSVKTAKVRIKPNRKGKDNYVLECCCHPILSAVLIEETLQFSLCNSVCIALTSSWVIRCMW